MLDFRFPENCYGFRRLIAYLFSVSFSTVIFASPPSKPSEASLCEQRLVAGVSEENAGRYLHRGNSLSDQKAILSENGNFYAVSTEYSDTVEIFSTHSSASPRKLKLSHSDVRYAVPSGDGHYALVISQNFVQRLYDVNSGHLIIEAPYVVLAEDGQKVLTQDGTRVRAYALADGKLNLVDAQTVSSVSADQPVFGYVLATRQFLFRSGPEASFLLLHGPSKLSRLSLRSPPAAEARASTAKPTPSLNEARRLRDHREEIKWAEKHVMQVEGRMLVGGAVLSQNQKFIANGYHSRGILENLEERVDLFSVFTGKFVRSIPLPKGFSLRTMAFSPDGTKIAVSTTRLIGVSADNGPGEFRGHVFVYNTQAPETPISHFFTPEPPYSISIENDGTVVGAQHPGDVIAWNARAL